MSLEELVCTSTPVSQLARIENLNSTVKQTIPKELWRLVDALWSCKALKEKNLFNGQGDKAQVLSLFMKM
jgi:hypothetical protein